MVDGRRRDEWTRLSHLLALTYGVNRGKKDKKLTPADFNPFTPRKVRKPDVENISIRDLRGLFFPGFDKATPPQPEKLIGGGKTPVLQPGGAVIGPGRSMGPLP
jgi:hypothetical protein